MWWVQHCCCTEATSPCVLYPLLPTARLTVSRVTTWAASKNRECWPSCQCHFGKSCTQVTEVLLTTASHHGDLRSSHSEMAGATVAGWGHWANAVTSSDISLITSPTQTHVPRCCLCSVTSQGRCSWLEDPRRSIPAAHSRGKKQGAASLQDKASRRNHPTSELRTAFTTIPNRGKCSHHKLLWLQWTAGWGCRTSVRHSFKKNFWDREMPWKSLQRPGVQAAGWATCVGKIVAENCISKLFIRGCDKEEKYNYIWMHEEMENYCRRRKMCNKQSSSVKATWDSHMRDRVRHPWYCHYYRTFTFLN